MAKRFFYCSLGVLSLFIAYNIGARTSLAQGSCGIVGVAWRRADGYAYAVDSNGAIFATPGYCAGWTHVGQLPAGEVPTEVLDGDVGGSIDVMCYSGNVYTLTGSFPSVTPVFCSSVCAAPTGERGETWGGLKARHR